MKDLEQVIIVLFRPGWLRGEFFEESLNVSDLVSQVVTIIEGDRILFADGEDFSKFFVGIGEIACSEEDVTIFPWESFMEVTTAVLISLLVVEDVSGVVDHRSN